MTQGSGMDLQRTLDCTSVTIAQVGTPDDAGWLFARGWMYLTRYDQHGRAPGDLSAALADFDALPAAFPSRAKLASVLVTVMIRTQQLRDPGGLARTVALTAVANEDPRPLAEWPATAAAVRARSLMESARYGDPDFNIRSAVRELDELAAVAAGTRPQQDMVESARIGLRLQRDIADNNLAGLMKSPQDIQAFQDALTAGGVGDTPQMRLKLTTLTAMAEANANVARGDLTAAEAAVRRAKATVDQLPPDDPARRQMADLIKAFEPMIDLNDTVTAAAAGSPTPVDQRATANLDSLRALAGAPGLSAAERASRLHTLGFAEMGFGVDSDALLDSAVEHLRAAVATAAEYDHRQVYYMSTLGTALLRRLEMLARRDDLTEAIRLLERARTIAGSELHAFWTVLSNPLAYAYRLSGQRARGREVALSGLRGHAWDVLLQASTADAHAAARHAAGDAVDVAGWCIQDNDPEAAALALDAGRALILYAATETRDLGSRLAGEGRPDLADSWRRAVAEHGAEQVPGELRREVISVVARLPLDAHGAGQVPPDAGSARLLAPPDLNEVRAALTALGADALVYLVPGADRPGAAVVIAAGEPPTWVLLPQLNRQWGADFDSFLTATSRETREAGRPQGWTSAASGARRTLDELCERAWTAAIGPVLEHVAAKPGGGLPRIVLIPMGELVRIPWHAARRSSGGRPRYAVEDAVFSYAPSARLLCDLAWRGAAPPAQGCLIVADPDTDGAGAELRAARTEAWAIREAFYPAARYVGRTPDGSSAPDGPGTRKDVTEWLAGGEAGALLHLACHGVVEPVTGSGDTSYLLLSAGERLSAEELVSSAAGIGRPIALAVLGACSSGVCGRGDDEAFSLCTTLLANNVAAVVGTQWSVPDAATSVLMFMFHHFLRAEALPPAEALRRAQLWMIAPGRRPPASMPAQLRALMERADPAAPVAWAAFVHFGW